MVGLGHRSVPTPPNASPETVSVKWWDNVSIDKLSVNKKVSFLKSRRPDDNFMTEKQLIRKILLCILLFVCGLLMDGISFSVAGPLLNTLLLLGGLVIMVSAFVWFIVIVTTKAKGQK